MDDLLNLKVGDIIRDEDGFVGSKAVVTYVAPPSQNRDEGCFEWLTLEVDSDESHTTVGQFDRGHFFHPEDPRHAKQDEITILDHSAFFADLLTNHNRYEVGDGVQCNHGEHAGKRGVVVAYQQPHPLDHQDEMRDEPINHNTGWVLWETGDETILSIVYHPLTPDFGLLDEAPARTGGRFPKALERERRPLEEVPGGRWIEVFDFSPGELVSVTLPGGKAIGVVTRETTEHWDDGLCEWHPLKTRRYEIKLLHVEAGQESGALSIPWKAGNYLQQNAWQWFHPRFTKDSGMRSLGCVVDTDEWNLTQGGAR